MMMERRHPEHPSPGELEGRNLDDHREEFHDEDGTHDREQQLLLDQDRHGAQPRKPK